MPRKAKAARLWLERRNDGADSWCILDGGRKIRTGVAAHDIAGAESTLKKHLAKKTSRQSSDNPAEFPLITILKYYSLERVPYLARPDVPLYRLGYLEQFWGGKFLADIKGKNCRTYIAWRMKQRGPRGQIDESTARKDLETLKAAINFYHKEETLPLVPEVSLPAKPEPRNDWLTASQAAQLVWHAWRNPEAKHLARFALIAFRTGTRPGAILRLQWLPNTTGGWFDLERERLYRIGEGKKQSKKRQTPAPIHKKLLPHLRRWREMDTQGWRHSPGGEVQALTHVVHYHGQPIASINKAWRTACGAAGFKGRVTPHTGRHTAATWLLQAGVDPWEVAGYLGMSIETLSNVYGSHDPDYQANAAAAAPRCNGNVSGMKRAQKEGENGNKASILGMFQTKKAI